MLRARARGARERARRVLAGGERLARRRLLHGADADRGHRRRSSATELFGPITTLHRVAGFDEAVELANDSPYGLTAAIWTASRAPRAGVRRARRPAASRRSTGRPTARSRTCRSAACGDSGTGWREAGHRGDRRLLRPEDGLREPRPRAGSECRPPSPSSPRAAGSRRVPGQERRAARRPPADRLLDRRGARERAVRRGRGLDRLARRSPRSRARYGAEVPGLRPAEMAGATSPDIEWVRHVLGRHGLGGVLASCGRRARSAPRPRSGARGSASWPCPTPTRCAPCGPCASTRARCGVLDGRADASRCSPQTPGEVPTHSRQTAALPRGLRAGLVAGDRLDADRRRRRDRRAGASCRSSAEGVEGFSIDYPDDLERAERAGRRRPVAAAARRGAGLMEAATFAANAPIRAALRAARGARAHPRARRPAWRARRRSPTPAGSTPCRASWRPARATSARRSACSTSSPGCTSRCCEGDDVCFSSKGHDAPARLRRAGRHRASSTSTLLHRLRRLDGLPGHPGHPRRARRCTRTPARSAWASRRPRGFARAARLRGRPRAACSCITGDGELQEGQFWESLGQAANEGFGEITRDRRPQQDPVGHLGRAGQRPRRPRGEGRARSAGRSARCDGNDVGALAATLGELLEREPRPPEAARGRHGQGRGVRGRSSRTTLERGGHVAVRLPLRRARAGGVRGGAGRAGRPAGGAARARPVELEPAEAPRRVGAGDAAAARRRLRRGAGRGRPRASSGSSRSTPTSTSTAG